MFLKGSLLCATTLLSMEVTLIGIDLSGATFYLVLFNFLSSNHLSFLIIFLGFILWGNQLAHIYLLVFSWSRQLENVVKQGTLLGVSPR